MTADELKDQEQLIFNRIAEIEGQMGFLEEVTQAVEPSVSLGRLTRMEALNEKGVNEHILAKNKQSLEKLHNALSRIEKGTYGDCIRCNKAIPLGRLQLVPEALICVPCADKKR